MLYDKLIEADLLDYLELAEEIESSFNFYMAYGFEDLIIDIIKKIKKDYE